MPHDHTLTERPTATEAEVSEPTGAARAFAAFAALLSGGLAIILVATGGPTGGLIVGSYAAVAAGAAFARSSAVRVACGALAIAVGGFFVVAVLPLLIALYSGDW